MQAPRNQRGDSTLTIEEQIYSILLRVRVSLAPARGRRSGHRTRSGPQRRAGAPRTPHSKGATHV